MPGAGRAEVYFIVAMMLLILVVCGVAVWAFFKTYKKEMREKAERAAAVSENAAESAVSLAPAEAAKEDSVS